MFNPENHGYTLNKKVNCLSDEDYILISHIGTCYFLSCITEPVLIVSFNGKVWFKDIADLPDNLSVMDEINFMKNLFLNSDKQPTIKQLTIEDIVLTSNNL